MFQSPFAKPSGEGLSSSTLNVYGGGFHLIVGHLLLFQVGTFDLHHALQVAAAGLPGLALSAWVTRHFGRFNGGNDPVQR